MVRHWTRYWRLGLFVLLVAAAAIAYRETGLKRYFEPTGLELLRTRVLALGWPGAVAYVVVYTVFVTLGLPNLPFQLAAGAIYGVGRAFIMMFLGANLGALGAFALARSLGRRAAEELLGGGRQFYARLNHRIERGGKRQLIVFRLVPLMPFNVINYTAGLSRMKLRDYMLANLPGMLPLTLLHVIIGQAAGRLKLTNPRSWLDPSLFFPLVLAGAVAAVAYVLGKRASK
jgi:uncharacterized membrane protein YdjX (TVP38/TMEM64 family)